MVVLTSEAPTDVLRVFDWECLEWLMIAIDVGSPGKDLCPTPPAGGISDFYPEASPCLAVVM